MTVLKIAEAAVAVGKGRQTLYRKISEGTLSTTTMQDGSKGVDVSELERVFGPLRPVGQSQDSHEGPKATADTTAAPGVSAELEATKRMLALVEGELEQARVRERDLMDLVRGQLKLLDSTKALTGPKATGEDSQPGGKQTLWQWLNRPRGFFSR